MAHRRKGVAGVLGASIAPGFLLAGIVLGGVLFTMPVGTPSGTKCPGLPSPCPFGIGGEIWIETNYGGGMLNVTVANDARSSFAGITVVSVAPALTSLSGLIGLAVFAPFTDNGIVVKQSSPLGAGDTAIAFYSFISGASPSGVYTVTVRVTTTSGEVVTEKAMIDAIEDSGV